MKRNTLPHFSCCTKACTWSMLACDRWISAVSTFCIVVAISWQTHQLADRQTPILDFKVGNAKPSKLHGSDRRSICKATTSSTTRSSDKKQRSHCCGALRTWSDMPRPFRKGCFVLKLLRYEQRWVSHHRKFAVRGLPQRFFQLRSVFFEMRQPGLQLFAESTR